ncbi:Protein pecanex [Geodia barretti]|uniref:Pecanex-like protein n=1 Tax=Geodia barretti TaxID=519541 RepID=A0AA35THZ8_GEOBA|nr:Protein pecanex [Geodia barretti]
MAITGFSAVLYYGIFASITGGYVPYRVKNWWLVVFHLYLFLSFIILPLIVALAAVDHWLGWTLYGVVICATFLVIKIINFHLHKALDMNPEEDEDEGGEKTGGEEEEKEGEGVNEEEKVEKGASEEEEGERKELGLDGKLVEQLLPGQVAVEVGEKREGEEEERLNNHRDSASTLGQSSTYQSSQETAELQLVSSGTRADEEEEERREGGATAVESLLGMIEAEVEVRLGNQGGDSPPGTAKSDDALVIRVDTSSGTEPGLKQGSDGAEKTDENMETEGGSLSQPPRSGVLSGLPHSAEWLQHSNSSIGLMSPMHHSSTSPLQSSRNVQSYFSAMHPGIAGGSRSNTLTVRPSGLQRSVSLPLSRERTPPVLNQTASEVAGNMEGEPVVLLRSSPMREEPGSSAVELEPPTFAYRRRGALRTRRAFSQEVPHLSPYFRPRNQSAGAVSSAAGVHRAGMLSGSETTRVTLDEEEEERDEEKTKGAEDEDEPNPLVESVKHKLLEQGHLSLLDVVEKMPTTLHESIVTDNVSRSCLETITGRVPELQLGHLAHSDGDSSRGAIHWFEGEEDIFILSTSEPLSCQNFILYTTFVSSKILYFLYRKP